MGFSTSGATAIIFIGMLIAVGIAYPVLQTAHDERTTAIEDRDDRALDLRNSDIALEETIYETTDDESILTVNATNTGSTTLSVPATALLVDGRYVELRANETAVDGGDTRELWQPGEQLSIAVDLEEHGFDGEPTRVKLVTEHGIAETTTEVANGG